MKKHMAFNTHILFFLIMFIVLLGISISSAVENEVGISIAFAALTLLPIFVFAISPLYVVFSEEYIEIVYNFGQRERIKWSDIRNISSMGSWISGGGGLPYYVLSYPKKEKTPFFVCGEIPRTRKTKKFFKMYYKKEIV